LAADVLPEMPVKGRSADEERYLFAQLISSAPRVELSWHLYGPDGTLTPSPFIDRLRFGGGIGDPEPVPQLWPDGDFGLRPRPAYEIAVLAAPRVEPGEFGKVLGLAMGDDVMGQRSPEPEIGTDELAAARADVLTTVEPPPGAADVEPWFGFCGETGRQVDDPMWVTRAEATGVCPWRAFVQQRLGISPLPDPHLGLPGVDGMLVGQVVHGTLEAIVLDAADGAHGRLEDALESEPISVPWPSSSRLDELVQRQALRVARNEGLATIGMAPLLEARARRFLEVAHDLEWGESDSLADVLATEVEGSVTIDGLEQPLAFRADRVDLKGSSPVLADYKAAKPMSDAKGEDTRRKHLLDRIGKGRLLQASAYAGSAGRVIGIGRYAYLKPDDRWDEGMRIVAVRGDDDEIREKFETAVRSIAEGRSMGIAFPRVEEADGRKAEHCRYCRVAEACRRDDSGFRRRLVAWMGDRQSSDRRVEETARRLWWLGVDADGEQK
jgi:hypothetical protein